MITFLNFSSKQLQNTPGFKRKVDKVASQVGISKLLYYEIINIEKSSIDILLIDSKMYFHKVHLYSEESIKMLNSEISKLFSDTTEKSIPEYLKDVESIQELNLLDSIESIISRSIELLHIENTNNLNKIENVSSALFNVTIKSFTPCELRNAVEPIVKQFIPSTFKFKILSLSEQSIEVLSITDQCKLYQFTIFLDSKYSNLLNRYISAIIPYDSFKNMKTNLKENDFSESVKLTLPSYRSQNEKMNISGFLSFLISKYQMDRKDEGYGGEGLKNVYKFFLDTSANEDEAKNKVLKYFIEATSYEQKR